MGSLHGPSPLVDLIKEQCDVLLLSIYVNPTQFGVGKTLKNTPVIWIRIWKCVKAVE